MKAVLRLVVPWVALWAALVTLPALFVTAIESDPAQLRLAIGLFTLPMLAVWLTSSTVAVLPQSWICRLAFWTGTSAGWIATLLTLHAYLETVSSALQKNFFADLRQNLYFALILAVVVAAWIGIKARALPRLRTLCEAVCGVILVALFGGAFVWIHTTKTNSIA